VKLNELKPAAGSKKTRRRAGRGIGSGKGKTAGRGQKGQKSRSGFSQGAGWEGGRSRLIMRLPKRGFTRVKAPLQLVNIRDLGNFAQGEEVDAAKLVASGLARRVDHPIKLLADGELTVKGLVITVDYASKGALQAVADAGGKVVLPAAPAVEGN
jgi:large subunit ribosomal protein L15